MPDQISSRSLYPERRAQFHRALAASGFKPQAGQLDLWVGTIKVHWIDSTTEGSQTAVHVLGIELPAAFPFRRPTVRPLDEDPPIRDNRHQEPSNDNGPLCLWLEGEQGWMPSTSFPELHARIKLWFVHFHQDDWGPEDRPPDLHRYFPSTPEQKLMLLGDDWLPPAMVISGRFGVWSDTRTIGFAGAPTAGDTPTRKEHDDRLLPLLGLNGDHRTFEGIWFRLSREPLPKPYLGPMLDEIDRAAGQPANWALDQLKGMYGYKVRDKSVPVIIAVGYPGLDGQEAWLFLYATLTGHPKYPNRWTRLEYLTNVTLSSIASAPAGETAMMRRTGHTAKLLSGTSVSIFGVGAIGSSVTLLLAKAGIQRLELVDSDTLRPGNVVRHVAGLEAVGSSKTSATRLTTLGHAPDCRIDTAPATWDLEKLVTIVRRSDVVIDATATLPFSLLLNEICLREERPAVYATSYRRGAIGRIRIVRAGLDACLTCHETGYAQDSDYPTIYPGDEGEFIEEGCGVPTVAASAVDIESIANWAARSVLWLLQDKLNGNLCLVINDRLSDVSEQLQDIGVHWSTWAALQTCAACGRLLTTA